MADNSDIFVRFGADIDPLKKGVAAAQGKLSQFGSSARSTVNQLGKLGLAAGVAGAAIGVKLVSDSLNAIDAQAKLARQLGTTSLSIATLERATDRSGISMANVETAAKNLEIAMGEAVQGTGVAVDTLERMNLTVKDLEGMTLDEKILTVNQAIKNNIPATEQAAAAADLFGKKAGFAIRQLDPATIAEARREVIGFGVAVSDIDAAKIESANDAMATVGLAVTGVSNQFTVALAPALDAIANKFKDAAIETGGFKDGAMTAVNAIATGMGYVGNAIKGVEILVQSGALAFEGLSVAVNVFATVLVEQLDLAVQGGMNSINLLIDGLNNIPGVDISKLVVGKSDIAESMRAGLDEAKLGLEESAAALNAKLLEPLPSDQVEAFMESVYSKNNLEKIANDQKNADLKESDQVAIQEKLSREKEAAAELAKFKDSVDKSRASAAGKALSDIATLMQSGSKKQFEIGKAAAKAQTVISTYKGAQEAYSALAGIPVVGPALGIAAAGAAIAAGGIRLQAINGTSFGGGGTVSAGAAGGGAAASSAPAAPQQPAQERNLVISGIDRNSLYSGDQLTSLMDNMKAAQEDGYVLMVGT